MPAATLPHDWFPRELPGNVQIGEGSWLYSAFAFAHYRSERPTGVRVGRNSGLYEGTFFELGPLGEVAIGDFTTVVGCIFNTDRRVEIGDYVFIAHDVVIADSPFALPPEVSDSAAGAAPDARPGVRVGDDAWIGFRAVLLAGADIGPGAVVGCGAVVDFAVPAGGLVAGNPAAVRSVSGPRAEGKDQR